MSSSIWNDSLLTGITLIDDQHRELISRMDQLMQATRVGKGQTEVDQTLRFVVSYTQEHFKDEEGLQLKYNYPDIDKHKALHAGFVKTVIDLLLEFQKTGTSPGLTSKINKTLVQWLIQHIRIEDKKLAAHLAQFDI